jgi:hypothetical protein
MTLNFPAEPADGDIYLNYVYDATEGVWNANPRQLASRFVTSATTPAEPSNGDGWFNTTNGKTYIFYYDGTSGQWIESGYPVLGYQTLENLSDTTIATPTTGQVLKYDGSDWVNGTDSVGKILQVVSNELTSSFSTSSSTFQDSSLAATITPSSSASKIAIFVSATLYRQQSTAAVLTVKRGATDLDGSGNGFARSLFSATSGDLISTASVSYLDSPETTSPTTYTVAIRSENAVHNATLGINNSRSHMILMEVAG